MAEYSKRLYPGNRRHSITLQHKTCIVSSTVPVALLKVRARASRDQVKFAEIQLMFYPVGDTVLEPAERNSVIPRPQQGSGQVGISATNVLVKVVGQREPQTFFELYAAVIVMSQQLSSSNVIEGVDQYFCGAQFFG